MIIKHFDLDRTVTLFAVLIPLWGGIVFLWNYDDSLVKKVDLLDHSKYITKSQMAVQDLDARLERTEIIVAIYSRNTETLSPNEVNKYERAKARLINLETQRDNLLDITND